MSGEDNSGIGKRRSGQKWMVMGGVGGMQSREDGDRVDWILIHRCCLGRR